jgi:cell fate regulator YaaT (PSP1 superfamily)
MPAMTINARDRAFSGLNSQSSRVMVDHMEMPKHWDVVRVVTKDDPMPVNVRKTAMKTLKMIV